MHMEKGILTLLDPRCPANATLSANWVMNGMSLIPSDADNKVLEQCNSPHVSLVHLYVVYDVVVHVAEVENAMQKKEN